MKKVKSQILVTLIFLSHVAYAQSLDIPPSGKNCEATSPPQGSGEVSGHGYTLKVFPRASDITSSYSGCQVSWAKTSGNEQIMYISEIVSGFAVRLWSPDNKLQSKVRGCKYENGKSLPGNSNECPAAQTLVIASMPAGCIEKIKENYLEATKGTCEYDFPMSIFANKSSKPTR